MFFNKGNPEPKASGFLEEPTSHIRCEEDKEQLRQNAISRIKNGQKVIIAYERLATTGTEGYVTLMYK